MDASDLNEQEEGIVAKFLGKATDWFVKARQKIVKAIAEAIAEGVIEGEEIVAFTVGTTSPAEFWSYIPILSMYYHWNEKSWYVVLTNRRLAMLRFDELRPSKLYEKRFMKLTDIGLVAMVPGVLTTSLDVHFRGKSIRIKDLDRTAAEEFVKHFESCRRA